MILQKQVEKFFFIRNTRSILQFLLFRYGDVAKNYFNTDDLSKICREESNILNQLNDTQRRIFKMKIKQLEKFTIKKAYNDAASTLKIASILGYMLQSVFDEGNIEIKEDDYFYHILQKILDVPNEDDDLLNVQASAEKQATRYLRDANRLNYFVDI